MMLMVTLLVVSGITFVSLLAVSAIRFDGDQVLEITVNTPQKSLYNEIVNSYLTEVTQWQRYVGDNYTTIHLQVPSQILDVFIQELTHADITYRVMIDDVQRLVDSEALSNAVQRRKNAKRKRRKRQSELNQLQDVISQLIGYYATYEELSDWLYELQNTFPNVAVLNVIGKTYQGRDVYAIKIGSNTPSTVKHAIWVDAGAHAREWIAVSSAVHIIYKIMSYYAGLLDADEGTSIYTDLDWYIAPLTNPDGYVFTQDPNGNRLWRKNRSQYPVTSYSSYYNMTCHGTDINRNFDFHWNTNLESGSVDPCIEVYVGPNAASENETQALSEFILANNDTIRGYTTLHSYSQIFVTRWSYTDTIRPPEFNQTLEVTKEATEAINSVNGTVYQYGTATELLYSFAGGAADWMREMANIKHSYEVELRDTGQWGFILPTNFIQPVGEEIWAGVKVVAQHVLADNPPITLADNPPITLADNPLITLADNPPTSLPSIGPTLGDNQLSSSTTPELTNIRQILSVDSKCSTNHYHLKTFALLLVLWIL